MIPHVGRSHRGVDFSAHCCDFVSESLHFSSSSDSCHGCICQRARRSVRDLFCMGIGVVIATTVGLLSRKWRAPQRPQASLSSAVNSQRLDDTRRSKSALVPEHGHAPVCSTTVVLVYDAYAVHRLPTWPHRFACPCAGLWRCLCEGRRGETLLSAGEWCCT